MFRRTPQILGKKSFFHDAKYQTRRMFYLKFVLRNREMHINLKSKILLFFYKYVFFFNYKHYEWKILYKNVMKRFEFIYKH